MTDVINIRCTQETSEKKTLNKISPLISLVDHAKRVPSTLAGLAGRSLLLSNYCAHTDWLCQPKTDRFPYSNPVLWCARLETRAFNFSTHQLQVFLLLLVYARICLLFLHTLFCSFWLSSVTLIQLFIVFIDPVSLKVTLFLAQSSCFSE